MSTRLRRLLAARSWPIHLALAATLLPGASLRGEALFYRDVHLVWYTWVASFVREVRQGLPPLWDPFTGFGQPMLANPSAQVLYPTTWLALLLAPWTAYTVFVVGHLTFSAVGMTRLARAVGLRRQAALTAGAAWMLGGPMVSLVSLWHHFAGAAWMPWVVLAVHRLVRRPSLASSLTLAGCLGLQVLAGSFDTVLMTAAVSAAWVLGVARRLTLARTLRVGWAAAAAVLLAAALSAGVWLPALDLARRALRWTMPPERLALWAVPPAGLLRLLLPFETTGRLAWTESARRALFDVPREPFLNSLYVGAAAVALAVAALLDRRRRRVVAALVALAIPSVLVALGPHAPFHALALRFVPGVSVVRYPSKVMVVVSFVVALLAGTGLSALGGRRRARLAAGFAALGVAALLLTGAGLLGPGVRMLVDWHVLGGVEGIEVDAAPFALRMLAQALLALLAGVVLLRAPAPSDRRSRRPGLLLALCVVGDLLLAHYDLNPTVAPGVLVLPPPVLSAVDRSGHGRLYVYEYSIIPGTAARLLGRQAAYPVRLAPPGFDTRTERVLSLRIYPVPPVAGTWGIEGSYDLDMLGLQPLPLWGLNYSLRNVEGTPVHARLLRLASVRTVVALHRKGLEDLTEGPSFPSLFPEPIRTFAVPGALPRARVVPRARALDGRAALEALMAPDFDPASEVILSGEGAMAAAAAARGTGTARIVELCGDRVRLDVELEAPGVVMLADAWDPGWRVRVDGVPTGLLRADVGFRAVAVPAGRHRVEMRYRPPALLVGLSLSAFGACAIAVAALLLAARRLSPASSTSSAGRPAAPAS